MVFSDAKNIETDLIGQFNFIEQIAESLAGADGFTRDGIADRGGEAVDPDLH